MIPILNMGWLQIGVSAFTMHDQAVPPVPPAPTPLKAIPGLIEGPVPMGWPPGFIVHKKAPKVFVDGNPGIQSGHDIGYLIPHFAIPMNALCAVHMVFSKHKPMYSVSRVLLEKKPAGTYLFFLLGIICASPVSLPTGVLIILKCTVWSSFSWTDLLVCVVMIGIEIGFDLLWNKITGKVKWLKPAPFAGPKALEVLGGLTFREMVMWGGHGLVGRYILSQVANKGIQHIIKSWVVGPMVKNLPRGSSGLGRGRASVKFFEGNWW